MTLRLRLAILIVLVACTGCRSMLRHEAEKPYREALAEGRMSPAEYNQQVDEIRQASEPTR